MDNNFPRACTHMPDDKPFDPFLRKKRIVAELKIHPSTLDAWVDKGTFPKPVVLNAGVGGREIVAWRESEVRAWMAALPQRKARPVSERAYAARRAQPSARRRK